MDKIKNKRNFWFKLTVPIILGTLSFIAGIDLVVKAINMHDAQISAYKAEIESKDKLLKKEKALKKEIQIKFDAFKQLEENNIDFEEFKNIVLYINTVAPEYNLDPDVVLVIAYIESRFDANAKSKTGDHGIMQINHRAWGKHFNVSKSDLYNFEINIDLACQILDYCRNKVGHKYIDAYHTGVVGVHSAGKEYSLQVIKIYTQIKQFTKA